MKARHKTWQFNKFWISVGMSKQFAISIYINELFAGIDIGCFYFSIEY